MRQTEGHNKKLQQQLQQRLQEHDDAVHARIRDTKVCLMLDDEATDDARWMCGVAWFVLTARCSRR